MRHAIYPGSSARRATPARVRAWSIAVACALCCCRSARRRRRPISGSATTPASRVGVAVGYKDADGWTTEGWWNLPSRTCETVLKGNLVARYYYVYAIDYDRGGEWMGQAFMCTRDKEFTIRGIGDCLARGYDRTGFFEVDTGEQRAWTVQLTESSEQPPQRPLSAGNALAPPAAAGAMRSARRRPPARALRARHRPPPEAEPMRRQRRTKVVATLGPASSSRTMIDRLFAAGADVFRINMSHTIHDKMRELVDDDPRGRSRIQPADRHPGRSARAEAAARQFQERLGAKSTPARISCSTPIRRRATRRACTCRIRKSSPRSSRATRFSSTTASCA